MESKSDSSILQQAIEAFNYPEEMGESVDDSVETLNELLKELPKSSELFGAIKWMINELYKSYEVAAGSGSLYSLLRISDSGSLEGYIHRKKKWGQINA
ncbi:MAG: hypothetical protein K6L75_10785 [Cellvibrionaceae bacterium]